MTEQEARELVKRLLKEMAEEAGKPEAMEKRKLHSYPWVGVIQSNLPEEPGESAK